MRIKCLLLCPYIVGEKRKPSEPLPHEENKRPRVVGDIPMDLINEVMSTITDPAAIPEVRIDSFVWIHICMNRTLRMKRKKPCMLCPIYLQLELGIESIFIDIKQICSLKIGKT